MSQWGTLSADQIRDLARQLIDAEPLLHKVEPAQVGARLGFRECDDKRYSGVLRLDSGLGVGGCTAELWLDDDGRGVSGVSVPVCDLAKPRSAASEAFCQDVFAVATRALTEEFGAPTRTDPGSTPEAHWRLDTATLTLRRGPVAVRLSMKRTSDADELHERAAQETP